jgi:hypothetical protein
MSINRVCLILPKIRDTKIGVSLFTGKARPGGHVPYLAQSDPNFQSNAFKFF